MAMPTVKDLVDLPAVLRVDHLRLALSFVKAKIWLVHQQGFPVVRFGRAIRIPRDAFLQWLEPSTWMNRDPWSWLPKPYQSALAATGRYRSK
jgi:hypothetical protein